MSILLPATRLLPVGRPLRSIGLIALVMALAAVCGGGGELRAAEISPVTPAHEPSDSAVSTVTTLVEAARRLHPTVRAIAAARRVADAGVVQAGAWANPELALTYGRTRPQIDDLAVDRPYSASLSQRLEWWGKRRARIAAAQADVAASDANAAVALLDLDLEVRLAAIAYASAREALSQAGGQAALAKELSDVVAKRQAVGDIDLGAAAQVRVEATTARLRYEAAKRAVQTALAVLRTWCGETVPDSLVLADVFTDMEPNDTAASGMHPRIRAALEAERASEARALAEREGRIPDVTIGVFGEREWEKDTLGVSVGVEIPLWNRNNGGIAAADAERGRLAATRQLEELRLRRERTEAISAWQLAHAESLALRDEALPAADEAVRLRAAAFGAGDVGLTDVLEARRALLSVQNLLLDAKRRAAEAQVRLLAATATPGSRP